MNPCSTRTTLQGSHCQKSHWHCTTTLETPPHTENFINTTLKSWIQKSNKQAKSPRQPFLLALPKGEERCWGLDIAPTPLEGTKYSCIPAANSSPYPSIYSIQLLWASTSYAQQDRHFGAGWGEGAATSTQLFTQSDVSVHELLARGHKEKQAGRKLLAFPKELPQTMPRLLECAAFSDTLCSKTLQSHKRSRPKPCLSEGTPRGGLRPSFYDAYVSEGW